jgi:hypothetical protein
MKAIINHEPHTANAPSKPNSLADTNTSNIISQNDQPPSFTIFVISNDAVKGSLWVSGIGRIASFGHSIGTCLRSLHIRNARYMTARQRTICHSAYLFFFVVLSVYILQDSALGMTASERRTDILVSKDKQSQVGQ